MFCRNCGRELKEEWNVCPDCGQKVRKESPKMVPNKSESRETDVQRENIIESEAEYDFTVGHPKLTGRTILKILTIIAIACFFCPIYMVSCAGEELFELSGVDISFGIYYMDEEIPGNLLYLVVLILPILSFLCTFKAKEDSITEMRNTLKIRSYLCAICCGTAAFYAWIHSDYVISGAAEMGLQITRQSAYHIMIVTELISIAIATYLAYLVEQREQVVLQTGAIIKSSFSIGIKCIGKVLVGIVVGALILMVIENMMGDNDKTNYEDYSEYGYIRNEVGSNLLEAE